MQLCVFEKLSLSPPPVPRLLRHPPPAQNFGKHNFQITVQGKPEQVAYIDWLCRSFFRCKPLFGKENAGFPSSRTSKYLAWYPNGGVKPLNRVILKWLCVSWPTFLCVYFTVLYATLYAWLREVARVFNFCWPNDTAGPVSKRATNLRMRDVHEMWVISVNKRSNFPRYICVAWLSWWHAE